MKRTHYLGYKLTDWYPAHIKPVRTGDYIIGSDQISVMNYWDGQRWVRGNGTPNPLQSISWRGVAHDTR